MIKNNLFTQGGRNIYAAPFVTVLEYQIEGLLCISGGTPDRADNGYGDNIMDEI